MMKTRKNRIKKFKTKKNKKTKRRNSKNIKNKHYNNHNHNHKLKNIVVELKQVNCSPKDKNEMNRLLHPFFSICNLVQKVYLLFGILDQREGCKH